jgi:hypothetical protein
MMRFATIGSEGPKKEPKLHSMPEREFRPIMMETVKQAPLPIESIGIQLHQPAKASSPASHFLINLQQFHIPYNKKRLQMQSCDPIPS